MIRAVTTLAIVAATACAGPSSTVPTGVQSNCASGPRITGESEMGVTDEGFHTDTDATLTMSGRVGGGCFGAAIDAEDR